MYLRKDALDIVQQYKNLAPSIKTENLYGQTYDEFLREQEENEKVYSEWYDFSSLKYNGIDISGTDLKLS